PLVFSPMSRESTPANNGMPRNTSTEVAMDQKENAAEVVASPSQEGRVWRQDQPSTQNINTGNTELMETSTAVAARSPHDRSDQTSTVAAHRARPNMSTP